MAYDLDLADRVRASFRRHAMHFAEKTMMGGLCFMVDGKMCVAVDQSRLMVRLDPEIYEESLKQPGCTPMDFTGKPMRGFVYVQNAGIATDRSLDAWIQKALEFNPRAKASRKSQSKAARPKSSKTKRKTNG